MFLSETPPKDYSSKHAGKSSKLNKAMRSPSAHLLERTEYNGDWRPSFSTDIRESLQQHNRANYVPVENRHHAAKAQFKARIESLKFKS